MIIIDDTIVECPCCQGEGWLRITLGEFPDDPPYHAPCCHCANSGKIAMNNLSIKAQIKKDE